MSLSREELLINLLGFATIDRGVRLLFPLYSIVLSACLIIVSVKSFFLGLCSSLLQRLQIIISVVYKASKGVKQLCVFLDQSRFSLGVAKLMLICLGFDFSLPASDYTLINVIIVTKESIRKWRSTCEDCFLLSRNNSWMLFVMVLKNLHVFLKYFVPSIVLTGATEKKKSLLSGSTTLRPA